MPDHQRADARRNYARILAVAEAEVEAQGADASLEQIARTAGVGSATVRRHFPTRSALLRAVSRGRIEALCVRAHDLTGRDDSRAALLEWMKDVVGYCVSARGLAVALAYDSAGFESVHQNSCSVALEEAAGPLLLRAQQDDAVADDVTVEDLITLAVGVALATEHYREPTVRADRLFQLIVAGLSPQPGRAAAHR